MNQSDRHLHQPEVTHSTFSNLTKQISNATLLSHLDYYHLNEDVLGIEVHCEGIPRPKVKWYHDAIEINPSFKYKLLEEADGIYKLEIWYPKAAKDSGHYVCKAQNSVAEAQITHSVQFLGRQEHVPMHGILQAHSEVLIQKEDAAKRAIEDGLKAKEECESRRTGKQLPVVRKVEKPSIQQKDRLKFATTLYDRMTLVGSKVKFACMIVGPDPDIHWLKDGNPIVYGAHIKNMTLDGLSVLAITKLKLEDSGEYKCCARNSISDISASCQLLVCEAKTKGAKSAAPLFNIGIRG